MSELKACLNSITEQSFRLSNLIHDRLAGIVAVVETMDEDMFHHLLALGQTYIDMENFDKIKPVTGYQSWTESERQTYGEISDRQRKACDALAKLAAIYVNRDKLMP
jgi:hypothetical protein